MAITGACPPPLGKRGSARPASHGDGNPAAHRLPAGVTGVADRDRYPTPAIAADPGTGSEPQEPAHVIETHLADALDDLDGLIVGYLPGLKVPGPLDRAAFAVGIRSDGDGPLIIPYRQGAFENGIAVPVFLAGGLDPLDNRSAPNTCRVRSRPSSDSSDFAMAGCQSGSGLKPPISLQTLSALVGSSVERVTFDMAVFPPGICRRQ